MSLWNLFCNCNENLENTFIILNQTNQVLYKDAEINVHREQKELILWSVHNFVMLILSISSILRY